MFFLLEMPFLYARVVSLASAPSRDKRVVSLASVHIFFSQNGTFDMLSEKYKFDLFFELFFELDFELFGRIILFFNVNRNFFFT